MGGRLHEQGVTFHLKGGNRKDRTRWLQAEVLKWGTPRSPSESGEDRIAGLRLKVENPSEQQKRWGSAPIEGWAQAGGHPECGREMIAFRSFDFALQDIGLRDEKDVYC